MLKKGIQTAILSQNSLFLAQSDTWINDSNTSYREIMFKKTNPFDKPIHFPRFISKSILMTTCNSSWLVLVSL